MKLTSVAAARLAGLILLVLAGCILIPAASGRTFAAGSTATAKGPGGKIDLVVLSNRADLISGGDALVQAVLPNKVAPSSVHVSLNGADITSAFAVRPNGNFEGLVTGLAVGDNDLAASAGTGPTSHLTITNHPSGGPVFAGPQVQPWVCEPVNGFPAATNAQCDGTPIFSFSYMDTSTHTFKPYNPASPPAAGLVATTTTDQGVTVPYIVRSEHGAMDRGLYDVSVLANPAGTWAPWASQSGWNHKVLYQFGGGTAPWHTNGAPSSDLIDLALSRGFMVANNNLNIRGDDGNDVVSAEALMMLKEHIAETYGGIRYTIGTGCSGGSIQQYVIAADYPGLLDGLQPNCSFQDSWTTGNEVNDCHLLLNYFGSGGNGFTTAQEAAVMDVRDPGVCTAWNASFSPVSIPSLVSNCHLQNTPFASLVYNPVTNPGGVRCTIQDYQSAIWGFRPDRRLRPQSVLERGRAVRPQCAERRDDHAGAIRRAQPGHRRNRHRPELHRSADAGGQDARIRSRTAPARSRTARNSRMCRSSTCAGRSICSTTSTLTTTRT